MKRFGKDEVSVIAVCSLIAAVALVSSGCQTAEPSYVTKDEMRTVMQSSGGFGTKNTVVYENGKGSNQDFATSQPSKVRITADEEDTFDAMGNGPVSALEIDFGKRRVRYASNGDLQADSIKTNPETGEIEILGIGSSKSSVVSAFDRQVDSVMATIQELGHDNLASIQEFLKTQVEKKKISAQVAEAVLQRVSEVIDVGKAIVPGG